LKRIRKRHPQYRIAIIVITAPDEMIDSNIKRRAAETGRDIPQELRQASSIKEINHGVAKLTYLADLVASVHNSPPSGVNAVSEPFLQFVSMVDRSGNTWG
jgi:ribose 1,5-bisphosphokinase PhnN